RKLAADGWSLSLGMRRPDAAPAEFTHHQIARYDANEPGCERDWVRDALARFGRIDAVINNAGIMLPRTVIEVTDAEMQSMLDVNVMAPLRLVRAAWEPLATSGKGRVVTIVSLSGKRVKFAASGSYSVSKFAALGLAHAIRHAGWDKGIRSTAICPGLVATDMAFGLTDMSPGDMTPPDEVARIVALVLDLPNTASIAEIPINCKIEESF
ncbi:SDR family NAD(P)-dependent oxidoreductase, partial [Aestuariivirga sp.]|uniref:SDR family NAD(P)-dependent oxidoreductase n=1 Tax=Aestuariivirga sp. TaxID=2650926 RepID=UPI003594051C